MLFLFLFLLFIIYYIYPLIPFFTMTLLYTDLNVYDILHRRVVVLSRDAVQNLEITLAKRLRRGMRHLGLPPPPLPPFFVAEVESSSASNPSTSAAESFERPTDKTSESQSTLT